MGIAHRIGLAATALVVSACSSLPSLGGMPNMDPGSMGCSNVPHTAAGDAVIAGGGPDGRSVAATDPGQIFAGVDVAQTTAAELAARGEAAGFVVRFNMQYSTSADGMSGYGECWCILPPDGEVEDAFFGDKGQLFIQLRHTPIPGGRDQPTLGWGC
jgi:hypothetical protein